MNGDDTIRITIETGRLRESPLGSQFKARRTERQYVTVTEGDIAAGFVRGECIRGLNAALNKIDPRLR
jgi:hypothetical protein